MPRRGITPHDRKRIGEVGQEPMSSPEAFMTEASAAGWTSAADLALGPLDLMNYGLSQAGLAEYRTGMPAWMREDLASRGHYLTDEPENETQALARAVGSTAAYAPLTAGLLTRLAARYSPQLAGPIRRSFLEPFRRAPGESTAIELGATLGGEAAGRVAQMHTDSVPLQILATLGGSLALGAAVSGAPGAARRMRGARQRGAAIEGADEALKRQLQGPEVPPDLPPQPDMPEDAIGKAARAGDRVGPVIEPSMVDDMIERVLDPNASPDELAGNIRLAKYDTPKSTKLAITQMADEFGAEDAFRDMRRGVVDWAEIQSVANRIGITDLDALMAKHEAGQAWNAEQIMSIRMALDDTGTNVVMAARVAQQTGTPEAKAAVHTAMAKHAMVQETVAAVTTEAGRALGILNKAAAGKNQAKAIKRIIDIGGGDELTDEMIDFLTALDHPDQVSAFTRHASQGIGATKGRKAVELWMAGLLSGPQTHAVNVSSNAIFNAVKTGVEDPLGAGIGAIGSAGRAALRGRPDATRLRSAIKRREGIKRAVKAYEHGQANTQYTFNNKPFDIENVDDLGFARGRLERAEHNVWWQSKSRNDRRYLREALGQITGTVEGMRHGSYASRFAWRTELEGMSMQPRGSRKPLMTQRGYGPSEGFEGAIGGKLGRRVRTPFRALKAEDEYFKGIAWSQHVHGAAVRDAIDSGIPWSNRKAWKAHIKSYLDNPPKDVMDEASKRAHTLTFTTELGKTGKFVQRALNSNPAFKLLVPFFRTPVNLYKQSFYRNPAMAWFAPETYRDLFKRGPKARNDAMARIAVGASYASWAAMESLQDNLTGHVSRDPAERAMSYAQGRGPYSLGIDMDDGSKLWMSLSRIEPFGSVIGISADLMHAYRDGAISDGDWEKLAPVMVTAFAENLGNKAALQGGSEFFKAYTNPDRYLSSYLEGMTGSLVPGAVAQAARAFDPWLRDDTGYVEALYARVPGLRETLKKRYDIMGRPEKIASEEMPKAVNLLNPLYMKEDKDNPILQLMRRVDADVKMPDRKINVPPEYWPPDVRGQLRGTLSHELSHEDYDEYARVSGENAYEDLLKKEGLMTQFADQFPESVREDIKATFKNSRQRARAEILRRLTKEGIIGEEAEDALKHQEFVEQFSD